MNPDYERLLREVHLHALHVERMEPSKREHLLAVLDAQEMDRWRRLRVPGCQQEFLLAHGMLRIWLGKYLATDPAALRFELSSYGKPALAAPAGTEMQFNLAHSQGAVLIAITRRRLVGVDIEYLNAQLPDPSGYQLLFTPDERLALVELPSELALRGFYTAWTRKEAFIKATGAGFSADLQAFSVSVDPRDPPPLTLHSGGEELWRLHNLDVFPDTAAALVVAGPEDYCIRLFGSEGQSKYRSNQM